jgi:uncharacterized membrane protein YccC
MNSTPTPKAIEPHDAQIARADEQLAHAHEEIGRAGEELTRLSEQLAKLERDAAPPPSPAPSGAPSPPPSPAPSAGPVPPSPPRRPARWVLIGLPVAACIIVAVLVSQSSYGARARLVVARWAPRLVATPSMHQENPLLPAPPAPALVRVAAAEATPPPATPVPQPAPQDAAPTTAAALPDQTQLLQTMARDLANMERSIEQLKANQQQTASDTSKAIEALKASQEEIKRTLAKVSEQSPPKTSSASAPLPPTPALRKPERPAPYARVRPRMPREWIDDDEW